MRPDDLYRDCTPRRLARPPIQRPRPPLRTGPPDRFLQIPRGAQSRRGNQMMQARHRAEHLLARLGL